MVVQPPNGLDNAAASTPVKPKHIGSAAFAGTFAASVFIQLSGVLQGVILARLLGPIGRGEYAAVILWPSFFAAIGILGSNIAISRIAAKGGDLSPVSRSALLASVCTASLSVVACYLAIPWLMPAAETHLVVFAQFVTVFIFINHAGLNLLAVYQGAGNFRLLNITRAMLYPIYLGMLLALWFLGVADVRWAVIALLVANLTVLLARSLLIFHRVPIIGPLYSLKRIASQSVHFGLAGIAYPLYQQADKALLLWYLGAENLGIYMVALSAAGVVGSVTSAAGIVTFTMAARNKRGEGFDRIAEAFRLSLLLWIVFGLALVVILPWILPLVYGAEFSPAIRAAQLLILGSACGGLSNQLEQAMRGQGRAFVGLEGRLVGLIVLAVLGILLSRMYGLEGMCVSFAISQLCCLIVILYRVHSHYGVSASLMTYIPTKEDATRILSLLGYLVRRFSPAD